MKLRNFVLVFIVFFLTGCQSLMPADTQATQTIPTTTNLPRWMAYEKALAHAILNSDNGLCEWEVWGRTSNNVYVWALCKERGPIGTAGSVPAVVQLGENGKIEKVIIPRDGNYYSNDIRVLFPLDIQNLINSSAFNGPEAEKHIQERMISNGPPLIAASNTPLP